MNELLPQMCEMALQALGISDLTCQNVIDIHILPALRSPGAVDQPPAVLASYLAFVAHSGLLTPTVFDGPPGSRQGKELLQKLQQCAVTTVGNLSLGADPQPALHFPAKLQSQKHHPLPVITLYHCASFTCHISYSA